VMLLEIETKLQSVREDMDNIKKDWLPKLTHLVQSISKSFSEAFQRKPF
jgi:chromosome segregation ATPase